MEKTEGKVMYSNKIMITVSPYDAVVSFKWVVPEYNENNEIVSDRVADSVMVTLNKESFLEMHKMINELYEKVVDHEGKQE